CPPAFALSDWADVRLSTGERGSFLFVNNYQDDPIETTVAWKGQPLFGGHPVHLPARQGAILPLDWQVVEGITLRYATTEVRRVEQTADSLAPPPGAGQIRRRIEPGWLGVPRSGAGGRDGPCPPAASQTDAFPFRSAETRRS
ncbi:MAG: hypothetical protein RMK65_02620, partial [Anaerolineae bacterium]|nr:hypothetical protein [Anaerolineae bacterium]